MGDSLHPDIDEAWTLNMEKSIQAIGERANGYKIMHVQSARKFIYIYNTLMYICIICGPLSGVISGVGNMLHPTEDKLFPIVTTVLAMISTILAAIVKYGKFDEKTTAHKQAAARYTSLESNVRRQLSLAPETRPHAPSYVEYIWGSYDELFRASPFIPSNIYSDYAKLASDRGMVIPDEYGLTVRVDTRYERACEEELTERSSIQVYQSELMEMDADEKTQGDTMTTKKRSDSMSPLPDFAKFSEGAMQYELRRMMGFYRRELAT